MKSILQGSLNSDVWYLLKLLDFGYRAPSISESIYSSRISLIATKYSLSGDNLLGHRSYIVSSMLDSMRLWDCPSSLHSVPPLASNTLSSVSSDSFPDCGQLCQISSMGHWPGSSSSITFTEHFITLLCTQKSTSNIINSLLLSLSRASTPTRSSISLPTSFLL